MPERRLWNCRQRISDLCVDLKRATLDDLKRATLDLCVDLKRATLDEFRRGKILTYDRKPEVDFRQISCHGRNHSHTHCEYL